MLEDRCRGEGKEAAAKSEQGKSNVRKHIDEKVAKEEESKVKAGRPVARGRYCPSQMIFSGPQSALLFISCSVAHVKGRE